MSEKDKILVLNGISYGESLLGLGVLTGDTTKFVHNPDRYRLVLFTGGEDVDPSLYGETSPKSICHSSINRDKVERAVFRIALRNKIPMAGICRGLQFLSVMTGGRLIHHLDGHAGLHHEVGFQKDDEVIKVNSIHHQMAIPPKDAYIIGWSADKLSSEYIGDKDERVEWAGPEVEAAIFPNIKACGVQWHPEMMPKRSAGYTFFYTMVAQLLNISTEDFVKVYTGRSEMRA